MEKSQVFEKTYEDYLIRIAALDFNFIADTLGVKVDGEDIIVPLFSKPYRVSAQGITDSSGQKPHLSVSVILCKYLLIFPCRFYEIGSIFNLYLLIKSIEYLNFRHFRHFLTGDGY